MLTFRLISLYKNRGCLKRDRGRNFQEDMPVLKGNSRA